MRANTNGVLVVALIVVVGLVVLFASGAMTAGRMGGGMMGTGGGMMGTGWMGGLGWMWIPALLLIVGLGVLLARSISGKKQ
jgi:hypothetical protein